MDLSAIVRKGVEIADQQTNSLQAQNIIHVPWVGSDTSGSPTYGAPTTRRGVVEYKTQEVDSQDAIKQMTTIQFVGPIAANGAAERREPVDPRDIIYLPNGYTGPILAIEGVNDPTTNSPYTILVTMG